MSPKVMKKLVYKYIRYDEKYRKWMKCLGIYDSEEVLKNVTEEDGADGTKMKYRTKIWLSNDCLTVVSFLSVFSRPY